MSNLNDWRDPIVSNSSDDDSFDTQNLAVEKHVKYFQRFLYLMPSFMYRQDNTRLYLAYLSISGLDLLDALDKISEEQKSHIIEWVYSLQLLPTDSLNTARFGFQGSHTHTIDGVSHDHEKGHLAMTFFGLSILIILGDNLSRINKPAILHGLKSLQMPDGSFCANENEDSDMRYVYCAICISYFLNDFRGIDLNKLRHFIESSINYDGGFGQKPELESHGGSTFCAVASLHICGFLNDVLAGKKFSNLVRWCINRQVSGFQGRPNKTVDSCYSFWLGGTLHLLNMFDKINFKENRNYILSNQDTALGGFSNKPGLFSDLLHTYLGLCGLSLMKENSLLELEPALNMSKRAHKFLKKLHESEF